MWRALVVSAALALLVGSAAQAHAHSPASCHGRESTATQFARFSAAVWDQARWRRGDPPSATISAAHRRFGCAARPGVLKHRWRRDRAAFYSHRSAMLFRARVTPFYYAGHYWAAPFPIALCESGGNYYVGPYGAYGLILEPPYMSPREQDLAAHRLYVSDGEGPWAPFEGGCAYR